MCAQVRVGLESVEEGAYQKRVGQMRLLGELYNYRIVDSRTIFDTLYTLLAFGHDTPETAAALDPPTSYFRVRPCSPPSSTVGGITITIRVIGSLGCSHLLQDDYMPSACLWTDT